MQFKDDWPLLNKRVGLLLERSQGRGVGAVGGWGQKKGLWWKRESKNRTAAPHNHIHKMTKIDSHTLCTHAAPEGGVGGVGDPTCGTDRENL